MKKPNFFTCYTKELEPCPCLSSEDKVLRSLRDECDINVIFDRYCATDKIPVAREFKYDMLEYEQALSIVNLVKSDYDTLPSKVRAEFGSVEAYVDSLTRASSGDSESLNRMVQLGIFKQPSTELVGNPNTGTFDIVETPVKQEASAPPVPPITSTKSD